MLVDYIGLYRIFVVFFRQEDKYKSGSIILKDFLAIKSCYIDMYAERSVLTPQTLFIRIFHFRNSYGKKKKKNLIVDRFRKRKKRVEAKEIRKEGRKDKNMMEFPFSLRTCMHASRQTDY